MSYLDKLQPVSKTDTKNSSGSGYKAKLQPVVSTNTASKEKERNLIEKIGDFVAPTTTKTVEEIGSGKLPSLRDVAGSALEIGSYLIPAADVAKVAGLGLKGAKALSLAEKLKAGAKIGALSGAAAEAGRATGEEGTTLGDIATRSLGGAAFGAAGGAVIPAAGVGLGVLKRVATPVRNSAQAVENILAKNASGQVDSGAVKTLSTLEKERLGTAGKIVQGNTKEAEIAARALPKVDTTGVKTYADLSKRLGEHISTKVKQVEGEFAADTTPRKLGTLTQTIKSGMGNKSLTGKVNYVQDSLKQLGELYKKTKDLPSALRIKALAQKAQKEGLTPGEINELAKEYGSNFRSKGFSKTGEALTSINDQAFENTRRGLKDTARGFLKSDAAKQADKEASDLIKTKELTDKMVEKVNKLSQRIEPRNPIQKAGRLAGKALDMATFGGPKAFVTKLLFPSGVGEKQLTSLDIQGVLEKNLRLLKQIEKAPTSAVPTLLKGLISKVR